MSRVGPSEQAARAQGKRGRRPREVDVKRVLELRARGRSFRAIERVLGIPRTIVHRALQKASAESTSHTPLNPPPVDFVFGGLAIGVPATSRHV